MISKSEPSLLEQLENSIAVDADTMDPAFIASLPIQCHDMTSNQRFVHEAITAPHNRDIVHKTIKEMKGSPWEEIYTVLYARIAKKVFPLLSGRVLAQTSPSHAYDVDYIVNHARSYVKALNAEGISNDRLCIKIATTSAGIKAARILKAEGIPTLGTTLFSLHQAIAASQAGMHAISMYFNEPMAHTDPAYWPDVADPATEHPMAARHYQIRQTYDKLSEQTGKAQPQMKTASFVSVREVLAMPELGADHVTLGRPILEDLMLHSQLPAHQKGFWKVPVRDQIDKPHFIWESWKAPPTEASRMKEIAKSDPLSKVMTKDWKLASTEIDYTADGVLDKYNEEDEVTRLRLALALQRFSLMEEESRKEIERLQAELA
ncbi:putative transaldolase [Naematelia encephala]|uniref:Transaldolase n=1 Tax=Naematelia encephala TaxID=71784 RepID=A0A1Y2AR85_9TREE|nr:putative transaldolase [Naematelia encephala]